MQLLIPAQDICFCHPKSMYVHMRNLGEIPEKAFKIMTIFSGKGLTIIKIMTQTYIYNGNSYSVKTSYLYWNSTQIWNFALSMIIKTALINHDGCLLIWFKDASFLSHDVHSFSHDDTHFSFVYPITLSSNKFRFWIVEFINYVVSNFVL